MARERKLREPATAISYDEKKKVYYGFVPTGRKRPNGTEIRRKRQSTDREYVRSEMCKLEDERDAGRMTPANMPTVEKWLVHWLNEQTTLRFNSVKHYSWAIYQHLIPPFGRQLLNKLTRQQVQAYYDACPLEPATVRAFHRIFRMAIVAAMDEDYLRKDPLKGIRLPQLPDTEVSPLHTAEVKAILEVCQERRNGTRWSLALPLGLRQGEALGMPWMLPDLSTRVQPMGINPETGVLQVRQKAETRYWLHGCKDPHACALRFCRTGETKPCESWDHGCGGTCSKKMGWACPMRLQVPCKKHKKGCPGPCAPDCVRHAVVCPQRHGGGVHLGPPKTRSGNRKIILPQRMVDDIKAHRNHQAWERHQAGAAWKDLNLVWCSKLGAPIRAEKDWLDWKDLLREAKVRDARVHDGRHTAATLLLLQGVDQRTIMDILGWSSAGMFKLYAHVLDEMRTEATRRVGELLWGSATSGATA